LPRFLRGEILLTNSSTGNIVDLRACWSYTNRAPQHGAAAHKILEYACLSPGTAVVAQVNLKFRVEKNILPRALLVMIFAHRCKSIIIEYRIH
jgi:hypothetical protein